MDEKKGCESCNNISMCRFHEKIVAALEGFRLYSWQESDEKVKEAIKHLFAISEGCRFYVKYQEVKP